MQHFRNIKLPKVMRRISSSKLKSLCNSRGTRIRTSFFFFAITLLRPVHIIRLPAALRKQKSSELEIPQFQSQLHKRRKFSQSTTTSPNC